jgi:release factor glutamine methyltransferase
VLAIATERLRAAGSPSPRLDAEILVARGLERDRAWLLAHLEAPLPPDAHVAVLGWVERRALGEPIAYIRGFKEWYGMRLSTDRRALIPRPETELLVDEAGRDVAARLARDDRRIVVRDVGTGSGAVAVALAARFRAALVLGRVRLLATDISADAVELASENLAAHGLDHLVVAAVADLLGPVGSDVDAPDVVIANLPYLRTAEVASGEGSLAWEPREALDGGPDGLAVIRALVGALPGSLASGGSVFLEIGQDQVEGIQAATTTLAGSWSVETVRDLGGHERIVRLEHLS